MAFYDETTDECWDDFYNFDDDDECLPLNHSEIDLKFSDGYISSINFKVRKDFENLGICGVPKNSVSFMERINEIIPEGPDTISQRLIEILIPVDDVHGIRYEFTKDKINRETTGINVRIKESPDLLGVLGEKSTDEINKFQIEMKRCISSIREEVEQDGKGFYRKCMEKAARLVDGINCYEKVSIEEQERSSKGMGLIILTDMSSYANRVFLKNKIPICFIGNVCGQKMTRKMEEATYIFSKLCKMTNTNVVIFKNMSNEEKMFSINEDCILSIISMHLLSNGIYCYGISGICARIGEKVKEKFIDFIQCASTNDISCKSLFESYFYKPHESTAERYMEL